MRSIWFASLLSLAAGCWSPRYFEPRENTNGTGPEGDVAAVYRVQVDEGASATQGEVRIWCAGAQARFDGDDEVVELQVGFELENNGAAPLELDVESLRCEELLVGGVLQDPLAPVRLSGSGYASPGSTSRLDLVFRPPTSRPRSIDAFSIRFQVRDDAGRAVAQVTPFAPVRQRARGPYTYGPYDGWGWGWGWGWGGGWGYGAGWGGWRGFGPGYGVYGCW